MKIINTTLAAIAGFTVCLSSAFAAEDAFVGKWKMNPAKSQLGGQQYKVEEAGEGKYRFVSGDDVETFGTDGKDYPTKFGNTVAITPAGPNTWKFSRKRDGKVISTGTWTLSDDGKTITISNDNTRPDGSTFRTEAKRKRIAGTSGFVGTWESGEVKVGEVTPFEVQKWQGDGYSLINPAFQGRIDLKLDGKDYTGKGPRVPADATVSGKRVDDRTMELTYKLKGKTTSIERWVVSADGKTLTQTDTAAGQSKPQIEVYERQ
ncbi:MAG: hypothetical protein LC776_08415 [Acidobacteria bacterium]|nr:hypothetical protein [Acidobacteriota bacterium]